MSTSTEITSLLDGPAAEVAKRVAEVNDGHTLVALHIAERNGHQRTKVLNAIEQRGFVVTTDGVEFSDAVASEVAQLVAGYQMRDGRPVAVVPTGALAPEDPYPVPPHIAFEDADTGRSWEYMDAEDLQQLGDDLIAEFPIHLGQADDWDIEYVWRAKGTKAKGQNRLGYVKRVSGELAYYAPHDFLVVVAADFCTELGFTFHQMRALMFHELMHVGTNEAEPSLHPHDAEVFFAELKEFGAWRADLRPLFEQVPLPGIGDAP